MPETEFFVILKRLGLYYDVCGERGTNDPLPPLRQKSLIDISMLQKCYEVIGDRDRVRRIGEAWRAFTNKDHQVVYIENSFVYTGP